MKMIRTLAVAALGLALAGGAVAQQIGMFPGFPVAEGLTGDETIPADTNQDAGPATVLITADMLRGNWDGSAPSFRNVNTCGQAAMNASDGTNATPVITETYYAEITVQNSGTVTGVAAFNGSDATDSIIVALANSDGEWVAWSDLAGTQQSGTDAYQLVPFTAPYAITPGRYFIGYQFDGTTSRYNALSVGHCASGKQTSQTFGTLVDFTPATTFTAAITPIAGLY